MRQKKRTTEKASLQVFAVFVQFRKKIVVELLTLPYNYFRNTRIFDFNLKLTLNFSTYDIHASFTQPENCFYDYYHQAAKVPLIF